MKIYPNPSSGDVFVSFKTAKAGKLSIGLYDLNGKLLSIVFNGVAEKSVSQEVAIKARELPAGTYIIRLQGQDETSQQKLVLIK